ncbi:MAG: hypothetical protein QF685_12130 [Verrucomicrobiota bacterium]|jgi:phage terminase small subunit|nr:hypothetical protein [Verrucomicrobiota bacterium]
MSRRDDTPQARFAPAIKAASICLVTCGLGLGYVWQKQQIAQLGKEIKVLEERKENLGKENKEQGDTLARLKSPQVLEQLVQQWNLPLEMPPWGAVISLKEHDITQTTRQTQGATRTAQR